MDGVTAVQSRIAEIQQRFVLGTRSTASTGWASAAAAAGLDGTGTAQAAAPGGTASEQQRPESAPASVTSSPSRIQVMPSASTTRV